METNNAAAAAPVLDFLFNFTFTRADEDHAHVYEVGSHVNATDRATAEARLAERNAHLTVLSVRLFAVFTEDGEPVDVPCRACAVVEPIRDVAACEFCGGRGIVSAEA